jgi:hypothetical protein
MRFVNDLGPDVAFGALDQLLDLVEERGGDAIACRCVELFADAAQRDVACNGLGVTASEPCCGPETAGQIECLQNLHDLLVRLHRRPPGSASMTRPTQAQEGVPFGDIEEIRWPSVGIFVASVVEFSVAADINQVHCAPPP